MSDHNERAFLKNKFKDFGAATTTATKSAVMSEINKKRRKKRFIIIFFLSAFVMAIGTITTLHFNNNDSNETHSTQVGNSIDSNNQNANYSTTKADLNNDKKQLETNEDKTQSDNKVNHKEIQNTSVQTETNSNQSNGLVVEKKDYQSQKKSMRKKVNTTYKKTTSKSLNNEKVIQSSKVNKKHNNEFNGNEINNDYSIDKLIIKRISFPKFMEEQGKLLNQDIKTVPIKENNWIVGLTFSYNDLRSNQLDNLPPNDDAQSPSFNTSSNEFFTSQEYFRVSSSMNLELSIIRKLKKNFYLESGIRYTNLNSITTDKKMQDHLLGVPLKVGYNFPLKGRWAIDLSTGVNYNLSISRSEKNIESKSKNTFGNFADFQISTAEFNIGISYFVNEKISLNLSPQLNYLLFYKEQSPKRYFHRSIWFGGEFGVYYHLK
ncbi:MAG: hypothetical protein WED10_04120 [Brumimicrobium sp.]